jgi:hypothetical protein
LNALRWLTLGVAFLGLFAASFLVEDILTDGVVMNHPGRSVRLGVLGKAAALFLD